MVIKIIAMGFVLDEGSYLRDGWNCLDCFTVVMAYVSVVAPSNFTAVRAIRALRPLRTVNHVKGMKVLVTTLIGSLPLLLDVFALCALSFFLFGIIAVQLCGTADLAGAYDVPTPSGGLLLANVTYSVPDDQAERMCSGPLSADLDWYVVNGTATPDVGSGYDGRVCPSGMYCTDYGNPQYGLESYDNILWAWLTIFQHITLSGWTGVMYAVMDALSPWVWIFYVVLVSFCAFFLVNLTPAVLAVNMTFDKLKIAMEELAEAERRRKLSSVGSNVLKRLARSPMLRVWEHMSVSDDDDAGSDGAPSCLRKLRRAAWAVAVSRELEIISVILIVINTVAMCLVWFRMPTSVERVTNIINGVLTLCFVAELVIKLVGFGVVRYFRDGMNQFDFLVVVISVAEFLLDVIPTVGGVGPLSVLRAFRLLRIFRLARTWEALNAVIVGMMRSLRASIMLVLLLVMFLFISALAGMQLFGFKFVFCDYVDGARPVCPLGLRVWGDCPEHFHCYLPCTAEEYGSWIPAPGSLYKGQAYCERFCATLEAAEAADATATAEAVVAGGGCEYLGMVGESDVPRANFDDLYHGLCTVFQLLTGENWNDIMFNAMRTVSDWTALYFIVVILIGNYLALSGTACASGCSFEVRFPTYLLSPPPQLNLFVAILVDNLDARAYHSDSSHGSGKVAPMRFLGGVFRKPSRRSLAATAAAAAAKAPKVSRLNDPLDPEAKLDWLLDVRTSLANRCRQLVGHLQMANVSRRSDAGGAGAEVAEVAGAPPTFHHAAAGADDGHESLALPLVADGQRGGSHTSGSGPVAEAAVVGLSVDAGDRGDGGLQDEADLGDEDGAPSAPPSPRAASQNRYRDRNLDHRDDRGHDRDRARDQERGRIRGPLPRYASLQSDSQASTWADGRGDGQSGAGTQQRSASDSGCVSLTLHPAGPGPGLGQPHWAGAAVAGMAECSGSVPLGAAPLPLSSLSCAAVAVDGLAADEGPGLATERGVKPELIGFAGGGDGAALAAAEADEWGGLGGPQRLSCTTLSRLQVMHSLRLPLDTPLWKQKMQGRALLMLGPDSRVRGLAARVVHYRAVEVLFVVLIAASCVALALDTPWLDPHSTLSRALQTLDVIFVCAFAVEAVLKITTYGFAFTGKHAYLRNGWNLLDFFVVVTGAALLILQAVGYDPRNLMVLRVLRALRALRALRFVSHFEGLRLVAHALVAVLPSVLHVALLCLLFYLIFAILAVNLFKGQLYNCVDADTGERLDPYYLLPPGETMTRQWCEAGAATINASVYYTSRNVSMRPYNISTMWVNPTANFDNVAIAMLSLFQVSTISLWLDIAYTAVDATGVDKQPIRNHRPAVLLFFITFVIVCTFFMLNLFVGVTLDKFTELQAERDRPGIPLTQQQQDWVECQRLLLQVKPQLKPARPAHKARAVLYDITMSKYFDGLVLSVVVINVAFMAMVHANMSDAWKAVMSISNAVFTAIFAVEAALKLTAFGPRSYLRDGWHLLDGFVVLVSTASVVLDFSDTRNISFMPVLRVLRVVRVLRLIRSAAGLQKLMRTLIASLPALANVGSVLLLFLFIYAVIGINLFGGIKRGEYLSDYANFDSFGSAMLLLFRMVTGESWDGIMMDCMITKDCVLLKADATSPSTGAALAAGSYFDPGDPALWGVPQELLDPQCAVSTWAAVVYFPSFVLLCTLILLQLVIAVLLDNLTRASEAAELPVTNAALESFVEAWSEVDGAATGYIHASRLVGVVVGTQPPLGMRGVRNARGEAQRRLFQLDIPLHAGNRVSFMAVLHALAGSVCGAPLPDVAEEHVYRLLRRRLPSAAPQEHYTAVNVRL
ncbi:hypothetical protein GPECTOR_9g411 [Gonium pectorale]|uniref:EF-hand domain-containing protein n=1 Tax=Gonium pectorale TaxID=33097 RepID=A0A150GRD5_GONPE|nr:hypothetical protein GPECTOR_9g411 [Gonium pectorale]|eukprot:KXZ52367.1 hypothetical protein GPECTOR_9g411 [Gonium pectorale]